jgi:hypothetical protein
MTTIDPWEEAAECERSLQAEVDPERQEILEKLRDLWIALGNESSWMTDPEFAKEIEAIAHVQSDALPRTHSDVLH